MKRGTITHHKTVKLADKLGIERWGAVGILESLWHATAERAQRGDIGRFPDETIAFYVGWKGDPNALVVALLECGWLEEHEEHRLIVHDWAEHADDATKKRLARSGEKFVDQSRGRECYIYFIRDTDNGRVKIGRTRSNPAERLRALGTAASSKLELIGWVIGDSKRESLWHSRWSHVRVNGEWFSPDPDLLLEIGETLAAGGSRRHPTDSIGSLPEPEPEPKPDPEPLPVPEPDPSGVGQETCDGALGSGRRVGRVAKALVALGVNPACAEALDAGGVTALEVESTLAEIRKDGTARKPIGVLVHRLSEAHSVKLPKGPQVSREARDFQSFIDRQNQNRKRGIA